MRLRKLHGVVSSEARDNGVLDLLWALLKVITALNDQNMYVLPTNYVLHVFLYLRKSGSTLFAFIERTNYYLLSAGCSGK